jgi:hypothetical protein
VIRFCPFAAGVRPGTLLRTNNPAMASADGLERLCHVPRVGPRLQPGLSDVRLRPLELIGEQSVRCVSTNSIDRCCAAVSRLRLRWAWPHWSSKQPRPNQSGRYCHCWEESPGPSQSASASLGSNPEAGRLLALFKRLAEDGFGQHRQSGPLPIEVPNEGETVTYLEWPMERLPAG